MEVHPLFGEFLTLTCYVGEKHTKQEADHLTWPIAASTRFEVGESVERSKGCELDHLHPPYLLCACYSTATGLHLHDNILQSLHLQQHDTSMWH